MGGATVKKNYLNLMDDFAMFVERTGLIIAPEDLSMLGLPLADIQAAFWGSSSDMLLEFCEQYPQYHIVTITGPGRLENKYIPCKNIYMLAAGDSHPGLVIDMCLKKDPNLLLEEMLMRLLPKVILSIEVTRPSDAISCANV